MNYFQSAALVLVLFCSCQSAVQNQKTPAIETVSNINSPEEKPSYPTWLNLDYVMGKFDPAKHKDFITIDRKYADRGDRLMHKDAYIAFKALHEAAMEAGINFTIKSAARNFTYQKGIWERKWNGETKLEGKENASLTYPNPVERAIAILRYSSMPGSSRHHWGTDIDLNSFSNGYFEDGKGKIEFDWLNKNAHIFGFCRPYTKLGSDRSSGYQEEKWHWSFTPISDLCTKFAAEELENKMISGFSGSEVAEQINIKDNYILGISSTCKK